MNYGVANSGWQNPWIYNARYAVLIVGGSTDSSENFAAFANDVKSMYSVLKNKYNYNTENLFVHRWNLHKGLHADGIDYAGPADWRVDDAHHDEWGDGINQTFEKIRPKMTKNDFLYLMFVGHGLMTADGNGRGGFVGYDCESGDKLNIYYGRIEGKYYHIDGELDNLNYMRVVLVFAACGSGTAVQGTNSEPGANLKDDNRIIITSCEKNEYTPATPTRDHVFFLWHDWVSNGFVYKYANSGFISVESAYQSGLDAVNAYNPWPTHPLRWNDGVKASCTYL